MSLLTSFKALKEILKPCSNLSTTTSSSSSSSSLTQPSFSQEPEPALTISRKPPKSSLSKQLQRLGEPFRPLSQQNGSLNARTQQPQNSQGLRNEAQVVKFEDRQEEEEKEREFEDLGRTKLGQFQFEHTGPFEPLVLSLLGEVPVTRVIDNYAFYASNCFDPVVYFFCNCSFWVQVLFLCWKVCVFLLFELESSLFSMLRSCFFF
jgi:hypothetical protein